MLTKNIHPLTQKINKKQKLAAKQMRTQAMQWLAETFPAAFDDSESIHPLKIGIINDIFAYMNDAQNISISKSKLRQAVVMYTRKIEYLACLKAREMRIDLSGNPTELVTEEEAAQAANKMKKRVEKQMKILQVKTSPSTQQSASPKVQMHTAYISGYSDMPKLTQPNASSSVVVIKHKTPKSYDPEIVARLKAKLGLNEK